MDSLITSDFTLYTPKADKVDDIIAALQVADGAAISVLQGGELVLRLPALFGTVTADATTGQGSLALGAEFANPGSYWNYDDVIAVWDETAGTYLNYLGTGTAAPASTGWVYDPDTKTVYFTTTASDVVYIYAVPHVYNIKVRAESRQPRGKVVTPLWQGLSGNFTLHDLARDPVTFRYSADLRSGDMIKILVTSTNTSKPFNPYLPDGSTMVKITEIYMDALVRD